MPLILLILALWYREYIPSKKQPVMDRELPRLIILPLFLAVQPGSPLCKEAPTQVIPLLMAALPAIDPNDVRKSMMAFHLFSTFCTMVPLVDCSQV